MNEQTINYSHSLASNRRYNSRSIPPVRGLSHLSISRNSNTLPHQIPSHPSHLSSSEPTNFIYGTNISAKNTFSNIETFIMDFEVTTEAEGMSLSEKIYYTQLTEIDLLQTHIFEISALHLKEFDRELYFQLVYFPTQILSFFDETLKLLYERLFIANEEDGTLQQAKTLKKNRLMTTFKHLDVQEILSLRAINEKHINRLVGLRGIVIRSSQIYPDMITAMFRCTNCKTEQYVVLENARISEPKFCQKCRLRDCLQIIHNHCDFTDKQFVKFQQLPQMVPEGQTPSSISVVAYDNNVDGLRPGDRVEVVGIFRTSEAKVSRGKKMLRSIFKTYVDLISFHVMEDRGIKILDDNTSSVAYNDQDKNTFAQMADSPNVMNDLIDSLCPSIYGHQEVKKGLLAQLFGGTKKDFSQFGRGTFRSDINICLVGDPSTAKSQLLQQVHKISPRGIYTSGRGSSAVGLTANVRKDPQTKQFVLESGALVLSDLGICCIDEFDKMDPQSSLILLQAMEQQTISIAKAGIVCQLNSRTSVLCAANPVNSKYHPKKSVIENINMPPALLSRFDLIYILLDKPNEQFDRRLAEHIINIFSSVSLNENTNKQRRGKYPKQLLSKYITYAKQYIHPALNQKAADLLVHAYSQMRKLGNNKKVITATTRQLESLIRISQAFAKMRLSNVVEERDVDQAIALVKYATQQTATDPNTGLIDMDVIVIGKTSSSRQKVNKIKEIASQLIRANISRYKKSNNVESLVSEIDKKLDLNEKASEKEVLEALRILESEGLIVVYGPSKSKPNFKLAKDPYNL